MDKLLALGFKKSALAHYTGNGFTFEYQQNENSLNILYALVFLNHANDEYPQVRYIGHTRKSFRNRMYGYQLGNGQQVNNRIHIAITHQLQNDRMVHVYCMPNHFNMSMHDLEVDVAAGLEYSLIRYYSNLNNQLQHPPLLNIAGNPRREARIDIDENDELIAEEINYNGDAIQINDNASFDYTLNKTYWRLPVINIPVEFQQRFGEHQTAAQVDLVQPDGIILSYQAAISRTANVNGTPRLYLPRPQGDSFQEWKHATYKEGDVIVATIINQNHLRLGLVQAH